MIDMQTMVRPLNYSAKDTQRIIQENCIASLRIFLRAYKVSDLDTLMILSDEYEELEKEREAFVQENKFSKTKSASPTQVTCRRCEETAPRRHGEPTNGRDLTVAAGNRSTTRRPINTTTTATDAANKHCVEATKYKKERAEKPCSAGVL